MLLAYFFFLKMSKNSPSGRWHSVKNSVDNGPCHLPFSTLNVRLLFVAGANLWCAPDPRITQCTCSLYSFYCIVLLLRVGRIYLMLLIDFTNIAACFFPLIVSINLDLFYIFAVSWYAFFRFPVIVVVWSLGCSHSSFQNWKSGNLYLPYSYLIVFLCLCFAHYQQFNINAGCWAIRTNIPGSKGDHPFSSPWTTRNSIPQNAF